VRAVKIEYFCHSWTNENIYLDNENKKEDSAPHLQNLPSDLNQAYLESEAEP